jgi:hypothetical protein
MTTVAETRTVSKAFYAHLDDQASALTKVNGIIYFVGEDATIVEITPAHGNFLVTLGEMTMADAQRVADLMDGGYAAVACSREEGVQ